ncbi:pyruvate decarboxylase [Saccharothrix sp. NRRL B-16348]|uniref:alpha-keto acid decarboxylase family protein n=1 Tax=Saccharothrix sp. NRRL B-16348 TaxID=1415542 RepID=UPI0006AF0916|nr:thiamine pyrophosphate-dependent enzyme [Saccharothrix sp. NRRL B-16348]KOX34163.1 pyruvate decarboxylase [Saccharothrix sp. NRRL B-16348]
MNDGYTVGHYLVDRLRQLGLEHLFSVAGDYSIDWLNDYVTPSGIEIVEEVNELNAGYAADGYARLKGIGALCVTYSAGALCAVNAVAGAYVEKVPLVLINGTPSTKKTITFEQTGFSAHHFITGRETDLQSFEHITVATARVDNADVAPMLIDYALTRCVSERRPVYVELLQDVVGQECEPPAGVLKPARAVSDPISLDGAVARLCAGLDSAENPLVWVGVEVDRFGLQQKVLNLVRQLNVPFVTELLSKAVLSEDEELFVGVLDGQASSSAVLDLVAKSDFVLALGVWLTDINSLGWQPDFDKTAFASFDAVKSGTYFAGQVALEHLVDGILAKQLAAKTRKLPEKPALLAPILNTGDEITYQGFYDFIRQHVDEHTVVGSDASLNYFGSLLLHVPGQGAFVAQSSYSAIGYIGPAATGLCLAKRPDQRVLVFSGDGGFQMTAQCLSTQTRFSLDPIVFVIDNGVYGVEQWLADASVFRPGSEKPFYRSCDLHQWDYAKLAEVFGCQGWTARTYGELEEAVKGALANSGGPSLIQVVVPAKSIPENAEWKTR